jgi:site-specific recombinase XerD
MGRGASEALLAQFEEHLVVTQLSPLTVVNYLADLRSLVRWGVGRVGSDFSLDSLSPNIIRAYRSHLLEEKRCAIATVNRRLQALRKFCAFAVKVGIMNSSPAEGVQLVKSTGTAPTTPLTSEQIDELIRVSIDEQSGLARRDVAIMMLLAHTGLRANELVKLCMDDVHFDHPGTHLTLKDGRHGRVRKVPLEGGLPHALSEYLRVRPNIEDEAHLFLSREGRPLSTRSVQRIVSARAQAAGLEGVSPQTLRRAYASRLLVNTGDLALVSQRLGHQNLATTTRYLNTSSQQRVDEAVAQQT